MPNGPRPIARGPAPSPRPSPRRGEGDSLADPSLPPPLPLAGGAGGGSPVILLSSCSSKGAYPDYLTGGRLTGVPESAEAYPVRMEPFPRVMVGEGRPSTFCFCFQRLKKLVDGRPPPTMTGKARAGNNDGKHGRPPAPPPHPDPLPGGERGTRSPIPPCLLPSRLREGPGEGAGLRSKRRMGRFQGSGGGFRTRSEGERKSRKISGLRQKYR